jgi:arsenate reductase
VQTTWDHDVTVTLYGIKNCDTVKKARAWLDERGIVYRFHDYKTAGVDPVRLDGWIARLGWEALLNRAGTTFRKLPDADKDGLDATRAAALMIAQPSMIRRPVVEHHGGLLVGFRAADWEAAFG